MQAPNFKLLYQAYTGYSNVLQLIYSNVGLLCIVQWNVRFRLLAVIINWQEFICWEILLIVRQVTLTWSVDESPLDLYSWLLHVSLIANMNNLCAYFIVGHQFKSFFEHCHTNREDFRIYLTVDKHKPMVDFSPKNMSLF